MEKKMNNNLKHTEIITKAVLEILGPTTLGYHFHIKKGKIQNWGFEHHHINDPIWVDGFFVEIDYDYWNDEKHKQETVHHLARYFPNIQSQADDILCHIALDSDNFNEVAQ
jgi:hypothetical protein